MHLIGQIVSLFFWTIVLLSSFAGPAQWIVFMVILYPFLVLIYAFLIRVVSELAISVLLLPPLLAKHQPGQGDVVPGPMGDDADLAVYGVGGNDMSTTV